jgi:hypothetical protein
MIKNQEPTCERNSPLSYVSAMLAQSLADNADFPVLRFFCGMHTDEGSDRLTGPSGMVKSLIGQLLDFITQREQNIDLSFLGNLSTKRFLKNVRSLVDLFVQMVNQLPRSYAVFCIVDSIWWYEGLEKEEDTRIALEGLVSLMDNRNVVFKLLLTDTLEFEVPHIHNPYSLLVPAFVDGGRMGVNTNYLSDNASSDIREFEPTASTPDSDSEMGFW